VAAVAFVVSASWLVALLEFSKSVARGPAESRHTRFRPYLGRPTVAGLYRDAVVFLLSEFGSTGCE